jgi:hypothetical protein
MSFYASRIVVKELITLPTRALKGRALVAVRCSRCYATRRDTPPHAQSGVGPSSLLSQALDQKQRGSRREDSVGPFQLGLSQSSFGEGTTKKWSELSPKGKGQFLNFIITLFVREFTVVNFSHTSDSSHDESNGHLIWCRSDDCPHLRPDVGTLLEELSYRTL